MSEQPAPYSQEAEEAVIGAVIANPNSFVTITSFLKPDDFFFMRHSYIWQALLRMNERRDTVDYLTLTQELRDLGWLDLIGGPAYLTQLITSAPTSTHAEVYGRLVERAAIRRKLISAADEIKAFANNEEMPIERVTSEAEMRLFNVTDQQIKREFVAMNEAVSDYFERVEYIMVHQNESFGVPSGFRDLDELLGGFQRSDLLIFAGRPGMGKTSWLLTTAVNVARIGGRVAIFTMEMGVEQLVQRMISMETGISTQSLRLGRISPQEYSRFVEAAGRISNFQIFIDDTPALSPAQMRTKCRRLQHEHGIDLIILDYMQLMNSGGVYQNNRVQEISYISRSVKELARELNVPVISAAQLSRAVEQRQDKRPVLSDLRESGCLTGDSLVFLDDGRYVPIRELVGKKNFGIISLNINTYKLEAGTVTNAFSTGIKPVYKLTTALGRTIRATANHKFLTICGWKRLDELTVDDHIALPRVALNSAGKSVHKHESIIVENNSSLTITQKTVSHKPSIMSDVYWDSIISIEPDGEEEVFDLTVQEHHNFVANNLIVHNSIEQDADIVMFLYRDGVYNETTEFPNQADIIIAKHRNGPTCVISLYFDKSITKFLDGVVRKVDLGDF